MKDFASIFNEHEGRTIHKWVHYMPIYDRYFSKFIGMPISILEIGVQNGGSLQMWKKYFGNSCKVVGIDIDPATKFEESQITVEIGSQSDREFITGINEKYGPFDIIIDDGSHHQHDVMESFQVLFPSLKDGGVYLVEDTHTAYFESFGGGLDSSRNFVNFAKQFVHDPTAEFFSIDGKKKSLSSISFYNSIVVLEKLSEGKTYSTYRGAGHAVGNVCLVPANIRA